MLTENNFITEEIYFFEKEDKLPTRFLYTIQKYETQDKWSNFVEFNFSLIFTIGTVISGLFRDYQIRGNIKLWICCTNLKFFTDMTSISFIMFLISGMFFWTKSFTSLCGNLLTVNFSLLFFLLSYIERLAKPGGR